MPRIKHRSSRRVPPPRDSDFDHEINLVDHSATPPGRHATPSASSSSDASAAPSAHAVDFLEAGPSATSKPRATPSDSDGPICAPRRARTEPPGRPIHHASHPTAQLGRAEPTIPEHGHTHAHADHHPHARSHGQREPESAIDVLYENQRGGFLCGIALFSSKALGQLDPTAWTNAAHKPSPTSIHTAQVPDPSWEWAWPEWRVSRGGDAAADEDGWVYSFMFSGRFRWHRAHWWNSFVRRRAWVRQRVKKAGAAAGALPASLDPFKLNPDYFSVHASSDAGARRDSASSAAAAAAAASVRGHGSGAPEIEDMETLLHALRAARIDREKIEAVEAYLRRAGDDLVRLQDEMHEIMSLLVFQASRRLLLRRLNAAHDAMAAREKGGDGDAEAARRRAENLAAAIVHADEEVRRLEYWSDIKGMAGEGESEGAVAPGAGWDDDWQGLDQSGPSVPRSA